MNNTSLKKQSSFVKNKMENDLCTDLCDAVENNDLNTIIGLISKGANVNAYDKNNKLPLQIAIKNEFADVIEELIRKGANINVTVHDKDRDMTLLEYAMKESNVNIVTLLVEKGANTTLDNNNEDTVLHYAAKNDGLKLVTILINKGINFDIKTNTEDTPLHIAAKHGGFEIVKYLCDLGANINARTSENTTPLHFAVNKSNNTSEIIEFLIDNGAEIDVVNNYGYTPLQLSLNIHNFKVAKLLVEKGADINKIYTNTHYARRGLGGTLLHWAARSYDTINVMKFLIENGADINATEHDGRTPLCLFAKHDDNPEMVMFLIEHGADVNNRGGGSPLYWACYTHHLRTQMLLIEQESLNVNAPIDAFDDLKAPLHIVQDLCAMELLIKKGANVNITDKNGNTPLHHAERLYLVKCLVENGADINARNHDGLTPLHTAYNFSVVQYLVEKGADIHATNLEGYTPLHFVKDTFTAEYLIEQGADVKAVTRDGRTVLHTITESDTLFDSRYCNVPELVTFFVEKGVSINVTDKNGNTPLHLCGEVHSMYTAQELLEQGADIYATNNEGKNPSDCGNGVCAQLASSVEKLITDVRECAISNEIESLFHKIPIRNIRLDSRKTTILHFMVQNCRASVIRNIFHKLDHPPFKLNVISKHNFVNARDIDHWMPLHYAAQRGDSDIVRHLLKNGSMYNTETVNCETPLSLTTDDLTESILKLTEKMFKEIKLGNYTRVVNCIKEKEEIINAKEKDGNSPLHIAVDHGYTDIIELLLKNKAEIIQINEKRNTVLHLASSKGNKDIVEYLLKHVHKMTTNKRKNFLWQGLIDWFVNAQATDGTTALHIATKHNSIEIVKLLLCAGASYNIKNKEGQIPVDLSTDADIISLFGFVQELFNDAKYGRTDIISKLQNLNCNEFIMVTNVCTRQKHTLEDILEFFDYKSVLEEFSKIKGIKEKCSYIEAAKTATSGEECDWKKNDGEGSDCEELGFGLFDL